MRIGHAFQLSPTDMSKYLKTIFYNKIQIFSLKSIHKRLKTYCKDAFTKEEPRKYSVCCLLTMEFPSSAGFLTSFFPEIAHAQLTRQRGCWQNINGQHRQFIINQYRPRFILANVGRLHLPISAKTQYGQHWPI